MSATSRIVSINVSAIRAIDRDGETVTTGIFKTPVAGRVAVRGVNVEGDDQADRNAHGGPVRAVYAYAAEDYAWWSSELARDIVPGTFGENLTTRGVDVSGALIGERWRVGTTLLQVTSPRVPCFKLAMVMDDAHFVKRFAKALRPGAYLSIVEEGDVAADDRIEVVHRPQHDLSVAELARLYFFDRKNVERMLVAEDLPSNWRAWVAEQRSR